MKNYNWNIEFYETEAPSTRRMARNRHWIKRRLHRNERRSAKQALKGGEYGEE